jgi:hypothetical protein
MALDDSSTCGPCACTIASAIVVVPSTGWPARPACAVGPPLVRDAGAGQVDDGVQVGDVPRVEAAGRGVPGALVVTGGGPPHEAHDLVTLAAQRRHQRAADEPGRAGDADPHAAVLMA